MTVTVTPTNHTEIDDCDAETYWTINGIDSDTDVYKEGSQSVCGIMRASGDNDATCEPAASIDMSGTKHMRIWFLSTVAALLNVKASGGIQFWASDGSNTGYWYVGGSDTYEGGWINLVADLSADVDAGTKPTNMNAITSCGIRTNMTASGKNAINTWIDYFHLADGLAVYGDDGGGYFDMEDIYQIDTTPSTGGWGIVRKIGGVYFLNGELVIGDSAGTNSCKFQAKNQTIVFEDRDVNASLYGIEAVDNGTGTTECIMGEKSGSVGINGCLVQSESSSQSALWYIDGKTDTDVDNFKLYGCTFIDCNSIKFPSSATYVEILSCNFIGCGAVQVDTAITKYCQVISAVDVGIQIDSTSHNMSDCSFIDCPHALYFSTTGTFPVSGCTFSGGDGSTKYDAENPNNSTNYDSHATGGSDQVVGNDTIYAAGQSFTGTGGTLSRARLRLKAVASPTGNAVCKIYASTGTNPNRTPTGTALATSNTVDVSGIGAVYEDVDFEFEDEYALVNGTTYFLVLEYDGNSSNYLHWEYDNANGDTSNNAATYTTSWAAQSGNDMRYNVYTGGIVKLTLSNGSNPSYDDNSGTPPGATIMPTSVPITITVIDKDTRSVISGVQTSVFLLNSPYTQLMNEDTNVSGIAYEDYTGSYPVDVVVKTRKSDDLDDPRYKPDSSVQQITASGLTLTVSMKQNPILA